MLNMLVPLLCSYGFTRVEYYTFFNYRCNGNEQILSDCATLNTLPSCSTGNPLSAVAINCRNGTAVPVSSAEVK